MKNKLIIILVSFTLSLSSCEMIKPMALTDSDILKEFAGDYVLNTGYWSYFLSIKSNNTFRGEVFTDMGQYFVEAGGISIQNGQITLSLDDEGPMLFDEAYLPIRWEQRKYLIELDRIMDFCESTKSSDLDTEPRSPFVPFYLGRTDLEIDAGGTPISPSGEEICQ